MLLTLIANIGYAAGIPVILPPIVEIEEEEIGSKFKFNVIHRTNKKEKSNKHLLRTEDDLVFNIIKLWLQNK